MTTYTRAHTHTHSRIHTHKITYTLTQTLSLFLALTLSLLPHPTHPLFPSDHVQVFQPSHSPSSFYVPPTFLLTPPPLFSMLPTPFAQTNQYDAIFTTFSPKDTLSNEFPTQFAETRLIRWSLFPHTIVFCRYLSINQAFLYYEVCSFFLSCLFV